MTQLEFVELWVKLVQEKRRAFFPDIRPSEVEACIDKDQQLGLMMWDQWGEAIFSKMTEDEVRKDLAAKFEKGREGG